MSCPCLKVSKQNLHQTYEGRERERQKGEQESEINRKREKGIKKRGGGPRQAEKR